MRWDALRVHVIISVTIRHCDTINPPCDITVRHGYVTLPLQDESHTFIIEHTLLNDWKTPPFNPTQIAKVKKAI